MELIVPVLRDVNLTIADSFQNGGHYPTSSLQKGLLMSTGTIDLAEEAVGFGLPVLKRGLRAFFPGEVRLETNHRNEILEITATFTLDLEERLAADGQSLINNRLLYLTKNFLAAIMRRIPPARRGLANISSALRKHYGWQTRYARSESRDQIRMIYLIKEQAGIAEIQLDAGEADLRDVTELIIMNEQGAGAFDRYRDSSCNDLSGDGIGLWDEVIPDHAGFISTTYQLAFSLSRIPGARLYRGREAVDSRLAWAGFGYSMPPTLRNFSYLVKIEKLP